MNGYSWVSLISISCYLFLLLPLYRTLIRIKMTDTYFGVILPYLVPPFMVFFFRQYVQGLPKELLEKARAKGVKTAFVTLHVGLGTFRPVKAENILEHHMHSELCMISSETAEILNMTMANYYNKHKLAKKQFVDALMKEGLL